MPPQPQPISSSFSPLPVAASSRARHTWHLSGFQTDVPVAKQRTRVGHAWVKPLAVEIVTHVIVGGNVPAAPCKGVSAPLVGELVAKPYLEQIAASREKCTPVCQGKPEQGYQVVTVDVARHVGFPETDRSTPDGFFQYPVGFDF